MGSYVLDHTLTAHLPSRSCQNGSNNGAATQASSAHESSSNSEPTASGEETSSSDASSSEASSSEDSSSEDSSSEASSGSEEDEQQDTAATAKRSTSTPALAPAPTAANLASVAVYRRDWGFNDGGRFLRVDAAGQVLRGEDSGRCLGFLCRYRRNASQPLAPDNEAILLVLRCASTADAQILTAHPGFAPPRVRKKRLAPG